MKFRDGLDEIGFGRRWRNSQEILL